MKRILILFLLVISILDIYGEDSPEFVSSLTLHGGAVPLLIGINGMYGCTYLGFDVSAHAGLAFGEGLYGGLNLGYLSDQIYLFVRSNSSFYCNSIEPGIGITIDYEKHTPEQGPDFERRTIITFSYQAIINIYDNYLDYEKWKNDISRFTIGFMIMDSPCY